MKGEFTDVDTTSSAFENIQQAVKIACAHTKKQEYQEKGDDFMSAVLDQYISTQAKEAAEANGLKLARKIINLLKQNVPVLEIASICGVSAREVEEFKIAL